MAKVTPAMARHEMARREEVRREQTARPTAGETMTPDQLARVERKGRYCPMCDERVPVNENRECRLCGADTYRLPKGDI